MALLLNIIFGLAFAAAVAGAVHFWRTHHEAARRDGMQALAARRGWALTLTGERLGRAGTLRLVPRGGHPWIVESRPRSQRPGGPVTEYEAEEPHWVDGTLILVAAETERPSEAERTAKPVSRRPWNVVLYGLLGEDLSRQAGQLDFAPAPQGVTALASGDPSLRLNLQDIARVMGSFVPVAPGAQGRPVLILSPDGMRLRLRHAIKRPDHMERFLDLALNLSRLIGP